MHQLDQNVLKYIFSVYDIVSVNQFVNTNFDCTSKSIWMVQPLKGIYLKRTFKFQWNSIILSLKDIENMF